MKKVAIVTIYDLNNCGNRLQNYALQYFIENKGLSVMTIKNNIDLNHAADGESRIKNTYKFFKQVIKDHTDIITKNHILESLSYTRTCFTPSILLFMISFAKSKFHSTLDLQIFNRTLTPPTE